MVDPMVDEAGRKGPEVEVAPGSQDSNELIGDCGVEAGIGTSVSAGKIISGSLHSAAISRRVFPSRESNDVAAGEMLRSAAATAPGGDGSVGRGLV